MNNTICLTATLIAIRVVVGGWKSLVFTIQYNNRDSYKCPAISWGGGIMHVNGANLYLQYSQVFCAGDDEIIPEPGPQASKLKIYTHR